MKLAQLLLADIGGGAGHQVLSRLTFWEGNNLTDIGFTGKKHHEAIDSRSDATVGRRAVFKGLKHMPELTLGFVYIQPNKTEDLLR